MTTLLWVGGAGLFVLLAYAAGYCQGQRDYLRFHERGR